jgi:orotidine-5'-phosphate decarboxylase
MDFIKNIEKQIDTNNSLLCIGLDPVKEKLPVHLKESKDPFFEFNKAIVDATADVAACYKPNAAFYAAEGVEGIVALQQTIQYIHKKYKTPVILDAKVADIGNTSEAYAKYAFDYLKADGLTVNPYMGKDSLVPFLTRKEKGVIVLCHTSNEGAHDFQDVWVADRDTFHYVIVAEKIREWHEEFGNCMMVVGATYPEQLEYLRDVTEDIFFLVPGIGAQGGNLEQVMKAGLRDDKSGLLLNSSRSILYAGAGRDFAEKARAEAEKMRDEINKYR